MNGNSPLLEIKDLQVSINDNEILKKLNLTETHIVLSILKEELNEKIGSLNLNSDLRNISRSLIDNYLNKNVLPGSKFRRSTKKLCRIRITFKNPR